MQELFFISREEFQKIERTVNDENLKASLIADMNRLNALTAVKKAGSGHLGSSFSSMDIFTYLYYCYMNTRHLSETDPNRDIFFSSKGHDVPGQYAVLYSLGLLLKENLLNLRRICGLCGHPDVSTPYIEANTGSLGMGISKAKGFSIGKSIKKNSGKVIVLLGDGELQEGQNFEALQSTPHLGISNIIVIIDHNKVQSDKLVENILELKNLENKLTSFGWHVQRCCGHDFSQLSEALKACEKINDKPKILICDTIKGKGVSFMEHPIALKNGMGSYRWHSGAPDDDSYLKGAKEILTRIQNNLVNIGNDSLLIENIQLDDKKPSSVSDEYVVNSYGDELTKIGSERSDIIVLDADLAVDCRIRRFEELFPERFIECGIAEQDMVSTAGGLALEGLLPIVNSFGSFLTSRANEQIYNNACEKKKIIYVSHYAGLIPAGPGQSHQCLRDIGLINSIPNITVVQPCNDLETRKLLRYCVNNEISSSMIRLIIGPSPRKIQLPEDYELIKGQGVILKQGEEVVIFSYGPVMLHESLTAAEFLKKSNIGVEVINMPWLNIVNESWLAETIHSKKCVYVIEDHNINGGLGSLIVNKIASNQNLSHIKTQILGINSLPAWGRPDEVLKYHKLDGISIAQIIYDNCYSNRI